MACSCRLFTYDAGGKNETSVIAVRVSDRVNFRGSLAALRSLIVKNVMGRTFIEIY